MMESKKEVILQVKNLKQWFKLGSGRHKTFVKAVDDVSFEVYKGEVFSLVGESGCGKTTTGRSIIKLYENTGGEVYFHNTRISSDVKASKKAYKELVSNSKKIYKQAATDLKVKLDNQSINEDDYKAELDRLKKELEADKNAAYQQYKQALLDRHFERQLDSEGLKAKNNIEQLEQYQRIVAKYQAENDVINAELKALSDKKQAITSREVLSDEDKAELKALNGDIANQEKELKLNKIRQKQDIANLKYSLIKRNRLLMRKMQMIFQDPIASLNPRMTVKEIIAEGLRINGVKNEKEIDDRVKESLKVVGLVPEHASRYPHEFSGGQRQRIGIARALVVEPSFIIADEPISALDVSIRAQIINLLNELREKKGITILFIAHDLSVVKYFSDRLAVMYYGKIVEMGDKEKIFNNPLHPYTLSLLNSIPLPDPLYERERGKTKRYIPEESHDYSKEQPELREIEPNHFVLCNTEEYNRYLKTTNKQ